MMTDTSNTKTEVGNYFVSNYPPFSQWNPEHVPDAINALSQPPRVEQPLDIRARPIQTGAVPRGTETLLVVEDDPSVRHLARGVLESQGYQVLTASNGQDALHVAREHKGALIRLVVTDVIMPLMGGKMMAEWLKKALEKHKFATRVTHRDIDK